MKILKIVALIVLGAAGLVSCAALAFFVPNLSQHAGFDASYYAVSCSEQGCIRGYHWDNLYLKADREAKVSKLDSFELAFFDRLRKDTGMAAESGSYRLEIPAHCVAKGTDHLKKGKRIYFKEIPMPRIEDLRRWSLGIDDCVRWHTSPCLFTLVRTSDKESWLEHNLRYLVANLARGTKKSAEARA